MISLMEKIEVSLAFYFEKYGKLDWHWYDEGLVYAIQDYESSIGLENFSFDDWTVCFEHGFTKEDIYFLCNE